MNSDLVKLPKLDFCQVPMAIDLMGNPYFCKSDTDAMWLADFEVHIISDGDEWQFDDIYMGQELLAMQRLLPGPFFDLIANKLEDRFDDEIQWHIDDNIGESIESSLFDAREFAMARAS